MKLVINVCFGGFTLSAEALLKLHEMGETSIATPVDEYYPPERRNKKEGYGYHHALDNWKNYLANSRKGGAFLTVFSPDEKYVLSGYNIPRDNPNLIRVVEEMGEAAHGSCSTLKVIEIPDGVSWHIEDYDGNEHVAENHRTWG